MNYVVVIPAKNEEANIAKTLDSIMNQTLGPNKVLLIDDGSTDNTPDIIQDYTNKYANLIYLKNDDISEAYSLGGHIVALFSKGYDYFIKHNIAFDYIVKLDADINFSESFVENLYTEVKENDPGIFSGTPFYYHNGKKILDLSPEWHSHGQFKIYKKQCILDIGGIPQSLGWDTADNIKAISKGYLTKGYRLHFFQMERKVGGKSSLKRGRIKHGIGAYLLRYNFIYFILKILHDLLRPPALAGSIFMLYGYFHALINGHQQILSRHERSILRKLLWQSMFQRFTRGDFFIFQYLRRKSD